MVWVGPAVEEVRGGRAGGREGGWRYAELKMNYFSHLPPSFSSSLQPGHPPPCLPARHKRDVQEQHRRRREGRRFPGGATTRVGGEGGREGGREGGMEGGDDQPHVYASPPPHPSLPPSLPPSLGLRPWCPRSSATLTSRARTGSHELLRRGCQ